MGASGGVYAIFGMHCAELAMNWESNANGAMNRWSRLILISMVLGIDLYLYYGSSGDNEHLSVAAHVGGMTAGFIIGILTLENLNLTDFEKYFTIPAAYIIAAVLAFWGCYNYAMHYPPEPQIWELEHNSCCYQLLKCDGLDPRKFEVFRCKQMYDHDLRRIVETVSTGSPRVEGDLETCEEMKEFYVDRGYELT